MNSEELTKYIEKPKHGLISEKDINGIKCAVVYKPSSLIARQLFPPQNPDEVKLAEKTKELSDYLYFTLKLSSGDQEVLNRVAADRARFSQMVSELSFGLDKKVYLLTGSGDTLYPVDYAYPRMYGMSKSTDIMFVFHKPKNFTSEEVDITVQDLGLGTGDMHFRFKTRDIEKVPTLK